MCGHNVTPYRPVNGAMTRPADVDASAQCLRRLPFQSSVLRLWYEVVAGERCAALAQLTHLFCLLPVLVFYRQVVKVDDNIKFLRVITHICLLLALTRSIALLRLVYKNTYNIYNCQEGMHYTLISGMLFCVPAVSLTHERCCHSAVTMR